MLLSLTEAPLKPQQRMAISRCNLMPKMYHGLVLATQTAKGLETLDRTVRASIRKWLRLPKDTPLGFFHVKDGGQMRWWARYPKTTKRHTISSPEEASEALDKRRRADSLPNWTITQFLKAEQIREAGPLGRYTPVNENSRRPFTNKTTTHLGGRSVWWTNLVPSVNNWVTDGTGLLRGSDYIQAIKIKGNLANTRMRAARGRPNADIRCDAGCNARETLSHISQSYSRINPMRRKGHDSMLSYIEKCLKKNT